MNRTICDVLSEMRECIKNLNFSYMLSLIEEVQTMGNRMEAHLYDKKDYEFMKEDEPVLKKEIKKLQNKVKTLKKEIDESAD